MVVSGIFYWIIPMEWVYFFNCSFMAAAALRPSPMAG